MQKEESYKMIGVVLVTTITTTTIKEIMKTRPIGVTLAKDHQSERRAMKALTMSLHSRQVKEIHDKFGKWAKKSF